MTTAIRQEIAAAVNSVAGISCSERFRQTTKPGDAMVRLDRIDYPDRLGGIGTWQVLIVLAQDVATAEAWIDTNRDDLVTAVATTLSVRRVFPAELALDSGKVPVLFIEGTRED